MDKWTVIIPTIWKSNRIHKLLFDLIKCDFVDEIILIDNSNKFFEHYEVLDKVKLIQPNENIYVNPSWNLGVSASKNNLITISNDDINFNPNEYFFYLDELFRINNPIDCGFIGSHSLNYKIKETENPLIEIYNNKTNVGGWGCLFSFHKSNWKPIPNELKIWYGDNWIHATSNLILHLKGMKIETEMSTSSDLEEIRYVRDNDTLVWSKIINNAKATN